MSASTLADEKYLLLTTFRRNGEGVPTPVWVVPVSGGRLGFWTADGSGKTKRIRAGARVTVQPCNAQGKPTSGTSPTEATAQLVKNGPEFDEVQRAVKGKYGFMVPVTKLMGRLFGQRKAGQVYGDTVVVLTLA